ncbi:RING-type domain-containing protein [Plasmodiophora brassicae]
MPSLIQAVIGSEDQLKIVNDVLDQGGYDKVAMADVEEDHHLALHFKTKQEAAVVRNALLKHQIACSHQHAE